MGSGSQQIAYTTCTGKVVKLYWTNKWTSYNPHDTFISRLEVLSLLSRDRMTSDQIWSWCKIGQGQPKVVMWTNYDGPTFSMLYPKFHCNQPTGFGDFWRVVQYGHLPNKSPWKLHMKCGFNLPSDFRDVWKCWQTDDGCLAILQAHLWD